MHLTYFQQRREWLLPSYRFPLDFYNHSFTPTCGSGGKCDDFGSGMEENFARTPFHILLSGLAFTDLCTGIVAQPFYSVTFLMCSMNSTMVYDSPRLLTALCIVGEGSGMYFIAVTEKRCLVLILHRIGASAEWCKFFWTNHRAELSKTIVIWDYFQHSIENYSISLCNHFFISMYLVRIFL